MAVVLMSPAGRTGVAEFYGHRNKIGTVFLAAAYLCGGMRLAAPGAMSIFVFPCDRCGEYRAGDSYRVVSDSDGVRLLDMIVCYGCYIEASQLGLDTETIEISELALH